MQLIGPFKVTMTCSTDQGGTIRMSDSFEDGHSGIPFLLSLLGEKKKKRDKNQLSFSYDKPDHGPDPAEGVEIPPSADEEPEQPPCTAEPDPLPPDVKACLWCGSIVYSDGEYCESCDGNRCPACEAPHPKPETDADTGAVGYRCGSCGTGYGFICTEPTCLGPASKAGRCEKHQPKKKSKRKRASSRRKKDQPAEPCGHETTNKSGICDACFDASEADK